MLILAQANTKPQITLVAVLVAFWAKYATKVATKSRNQPSLSLFAGHLQFASSFDAIGCSARRTSYAHSLAIMRVLAAKERKMSERMFTVLVPQQGKPALAYPPQTGDRALANMQVLKSRGHVPIARTTANGITSDLSIEDMADIYDDDFCQQVKTERQST